MSFDGQFSPAELAAEKIAHSNRERNLSISSSCSSNLNRALTSSITSTSSGSGMQAINIDPLPREDMVLEGGEEGGTVDVVKRRRHIVMASCISFIFLLAIVLGITIPLVVVRNSPSADVTTESNSNTARGGGMKGDELLLSEGGLEDEQTGQFGSDVDLEDVAVTDAPTSENPARDEAIMGVLRTLSGDTVARSATPQNQAANFIINEDPLQMDADSSYLTQRYAVAVLYFSLNGPKWKNQTNLLSGERECEWAGVTCATNSRHIRKIVWSNNTMDGILPEEIGALDRMGKSCHTMLCYCMLYKTVVMVTERRMNLFHLIYKHIYVYYSFLYILYVQNT
jgi:hypothetical protein